jgi:hypothetical protein
MDMINMFNKEYNNAANGLGVNGIDLSKQRKNFQPMEEEKEKKKKTKPQDYLKDKKTNLNDILTLVKNKMSVSKTRTELKKMLENPEDINDFLHSLLEITKSKKEETKEMTGSGSSGGYSAPLFGREMKESVCPICDMKNCKCQDKKHSNGPSRRETKEATGSASSGQYSGPSIWAKSTNKKDWGPSRNTQIPGGKFVQVKKKCKKFPYCNQGDINALKIFENKGLKRVITNISESYGITENYVRNIIYLEMEKLNKH